MTTAARRQVSLITCTRMIAAAAVRRRGMAGVSRPNGAVQTAVSERVPSRRRRELQVADIGAEPKPTPERIGTTTILSAVSAVMPKPPMK